MDKIATGKIEKGLVDLDFSIKKNISNLAEFLNKEFHLLQLVYWIGQDIKKLLKN